jgi:hypothetical protein
LGLEGGEVGWGLVVGGWGLKTVIDELLACEGL